MIKVKIRLLITKYLFKALKYMGVYLHIQPYVFFKKGYIKISDILDYDRYFHRSQAPNTDQYDWERLKNSISKNGVKVLPDILFMADGGQKSFEPIDGNHRITILRELYGDDYRVKVNLYIIDPFDTYNRYRKDYTKKDKYADKTPCCKPTKVKYYKIQ